MSKLTIPSGYTYKAEHLCPYCMLWEVCGTSAGIRAAGDVEAALNTVAHRLGIDRENENSFDTDFFPKVILSLEHGEYDCIRCGDSH